jgi:hypothetical protein
MSSDAGVSGRRLGDEKERLLAKKPKLGRSREKKKKQRSADSV